MSRNASFLGTVPVELEPGKVIVRKYVWSQYFGMFPTSKMFVPWGFNPQFSELYSFVKDSLEQFRRNNISDQNSPKHEEKRKRQWLKFKHTSKR